MPSRSERNRRTAKDGGVKPSRPVVVGVTGGIGSGKSEVCRIFSSMGAAFLSADAVAADLVDRDPAVRKRVEAALGAEVYGAGGRLDRKRVARLAFHDDRLREKLDAAVHPAVMAGLEAEIDRARVSGAHPVLCIEAPLLHEAGAEGLFDYVLAVDAPREVRIGRVMTRDGSARADVLGRMRAQLPSGEKNAASDFLIRNNGSLRELERSCRFFYSLFLSLAGAA